ncbi:uncharacterized protein LOC110457301 [Mizuhopecten yessoensis]|uniref:Tumor necrosis factor ligand superfamily member 6 n=1 Tax=Mizuhopecten yessoensis TaxID=6573 RepID=A0A210Q915_MIZYE|nr:uncharacterized protein LOC110457301 [Mizuhopecten yessoensis]XP_021364182.1 uncharacterized protein LOC110457301 [Mizuhopecten yessoensis]XP_021364183.1 uncharacterized protein LOC110457301 [Mizuhopecten yessoensis]OWF45233.1 Tumor necrosis factor ligand superfamily member 6 [Mizuhopecten yessoensis]
MSSNPSYSHYDIPCDMSNPKYQNSERSASISTTGSSSSIIPGTSGCDFRPLTSKKSADRYSCVLIIIAIFLACFCVALGTCVAILFSNLEHVRAQLQRASGDSVDRKVCLLCDELTMSPFEDENAATQKLEVTSDDNGDRVCCANDARQSKVMFDLLFKKKNKITCIEEVNAAQTACNRTLPGPVLTGRVSAHLHIGVQTPRNDHGDQPVRNWQSNYPTSHIEGINLTNDRLIINTTGLYVVYSQIYFSKYVPPTTPKSSSVLYHYVYRYNVIYPNTGNQLLMESVRTLKLVPVTSHSDHTSYTSATLRLKVGDEIYVKVSNISMVSRAEEASFLGVVQIA